MNNSLDVEGMLPVKLLNRRTAESFFENELFTKKVLKIHIVANSFIVFLISVPG